MIGMITAALLTSRQLNCWIRLALLSRIDLVPDFSEANIKSVVRVLNLAEHRPEVFRTIWIKPMLQHVQSLSHIQVAHHCHGSRLETCLISIRQQPRRVRCARPALASQTTAVTDKLRPVANGRANKRDKQEQPDEATASTDSTANSEEPSTSGRPQSSSEAIHRGIEELKAGHPTEAIELFQAALELPGNGCMRFAGTVREYRCASEGEEQAALYNMACAYAALRQMESAIACLEGAFEAGLSDYAAVRSDPDLDAVRGRELDKLLSKYDSLLAKVFRKRRDDAEKSWLGW